MSTNPTTAELLNLSSITKVNRLIEGGFTHGWLLRIEHFDPGATRTQAQQWQPWGETLFKVPDALPVIDAIVACRTHYPTHSIRLHAEKLRPRTQMFYPLYSPDQHAIEASVLHHTSVVPARINQWLSSLGNAAKTINGMVFRIVTIAGMLLVSLLMLEQAMA
jgi:ribulose bisphosphate carboxylase small subunit